MFSQCSFVFTRRCRFAKKMAYPPSLWPSRLFDQNFGMCITPHDFLFPFYTNCSNYYRPWKLNTQSVVKDFGSTLNNEKELFKVTLDVQHFRPNELTVKVADKQIIVEGRHDERKDEHGFVSRHFSRRYALPNNCMPEDVISNLSSDGVLIIVANKTQELPKNEQIVPITLCTSCPLQADATKSVMNTEQKDKSTDLKNVDSNKKNTQIKLKEDHCCLLLKPELLREAAAESEIIVEKKKEMLEQNKTKVCQAGKNTSELLEQTLAKASAVASAPDQKCDNKADKSAKSKSEKMEHKVDKSRATTSTSGASAAMSTASEIFEHTFAKSNEAMAASEEKFDLFDDTMTKSEELLEKKIEKSSAAMSEKAGHSRMTKSEMSELISSSSKTSECIESSSSYQASMTTNIKEISEELSDFVCDILSSELDKTLEIKK